MKKLFIVAVIIIALWWAKDDFNLPQLSQNITNVLYQAGVIVLCLGGLIFAFSPILGITIWRKK